MKPLPHATYPLLVILFAVSFWSSGVMLIRFLGSVNTWSTESVLLPLVYGLSVPIIFFCIRSVESFFTRLYPDRTGAVYHITGLVLVVHAAVGTLFPSLYMFTAGPTLHAIAWLLWFGGITILLQSRQKVY